MSTCKDCFHYEPCKDFYYNAEQLSRFPLGFLEKENAEKNCAFFKDRSKFVEQQTGEWIRRKPDAEAMRAFHMAGIGKAMGENSIFWTCSICGGWGNLSQKYCSNCGAKMGKVKEAIKERGKDEIKTSN